VAYAAGKLEFSPDALSDVTPTYVDVTSYVMSATWANGQAKDLDGPQAGVATFVLKNTHRDFEPEYSAGRFAGNILPLRRFRWSITADGVNRPAGTWYATSYQVDYPDRGSTFSTVTVTAVDGFALLSLATLPGLDPPDAETYGDVVDADQPLYHWPLDDTAGRKMAAATGTEGQYKGGGVTLNQPNPVLGEVAGAATFATGKSYGRAVPDDAGLWHDSSQVTMEAVIQNPGGGAHSIICGPEDAGAPSWQLVINAGANLEAAVSTSCITNADAIAAITSGAHHVAATYDGGVLRVYIDGVLAASDQNANNIVNPAAGGDIKIGGQSLITATVPLTISHAAVYDYALSAARIAAHATAALSRGYAQTTAGTRIAALATHPLWSTAGIPAGQITVTPRMQTGQSALDEITTTARAETPISLFYFDDSGNPAYLAWDAAMTSSATFGDSGAEIRYDALDLVYDDEIYNQATVTRDGGLAQTVTDSASVAAYGGVRGQDETGLILALDSDARLLAQTIVDKFAQPMKRLASISLNGSDQRARTQILTRHVGDAIRVRRRGDGGTTSVDVITRILGVEKSLDVNGDLRCTWSLARGFDASQQVWRIGVTGYSEIGQTTILG
jgi:hypothetical protein